MPPAPFTSVLQSTLPVLKRLTTIKPQEAKVTIGVDFGSTAVKVVALGSRKGMGSRPVIGQTIVPLSEGQDVDAPDALKALFSER